MLLRVLKTVTFAAVLFLLAGASAALYHFHFDVKPGMIKGFIAAAMKKAPPMTVAATNARAASWVPGLTAVGSARAFQGIEIASQLGGVVAAIHIGSGQDVAKGAPLYDLDTGTERADLAASEAMLRNAQISLQRQQMLIGAGNTSKANLDTAQATRDQLQGARDRIKAIIEQKTLIAPFAGRLGIRKLDVGQYASPGTALITLQQLDPIYVDFPVPEQSLGDLARGETVEVKVDAYPGTVFKGKVDLIDARVQADSRSVLVRALFDNPDKRLLPGMFADVTVDAGAPREVVIVPRTAVTFSLYGDSVFVLTPKEEKAETGSAQAAPAQRTFVATRRFVRTGDTRGGEVAITDGLKAGEMVVAEGQIKLVNGATVVIDPNARLVAPAARPKE